jgi:hypothetical protein
LDDWLPEDHTARFIADVVDEMLDLSSIYDSYVEAVGAPPYDPTMMLKRSEPVPGGPPARFLGRFSLPSAGDRFEGESPRRCGAASCSALVCGSIRTQSKVMSHGQTMAKSWPNARAPKSQKLPLNGADDGIRTRDPHLGKVMLYQLSHVRVRPPP